LIILNHKMGLFTGISGKIEQAPPLKRLAMTSTLIFMANLSGHGARSQFPLVAHFFYEGILQHVSWPLITQERL
jgi:hypothetical protein